MPTPSGRKASIAENLAAMLGRQIAGGVLRAGDKLPSLRALAQLHGYAKNTVVAAFELLVSRGLVEARRGSGFYVLDQRPVVAVPAGDDSAPLQRAMDVVWLMREQLKTQPDALALVFRPSAGWPICAWTATTRRWCAQGWVRCSATAAAWAMRPCATAWCASWACSA